MNKVMMNIQMLMLILIINILSAKCGPLAPALYVFGDSLVDSGNNNLLPTLAKANYAPYGMNFEKGPTGRFTNGRTAADFIAEYLELPYSPAYMSLLHKGLLQKEKVLTGVNYASATCGILPQTGRVFGKCLNLGDQIDLFERMVKKVIPRHYKKPEEVSNYLSKSVFYIVVGNNDYLITYPLKKSTTTPQSFANLLIHNLSQQLQRLYGLGARKVIMFEIGPIGCMPSNTRKYKCVEELNQLALIFNDKLASMLHNLTSTLHASSFILGRIHALGYDAIINPSKYGLRDTSKPCCAAWLNGTSACIPELRAQTCTEPEKHYFFDGYHPTETLYKTIATLCFNASSVCTPNIQQLVSQN